MVDWHHSAQSWPWRLGVGSVAASFQIRLGFFCVSEGDRPERGKRGGPDLFSPVGLGRSPSVSKDDGRCAGCVCIPLPPPPNPFHRGCALKDPSALFFLSPPPSPFPGWGRGSGAPAFRRRGDHTLVYRTPPLAPPCFQPWHRCGFVCGVVGVLSFCWVCDVRLPLGSKVASGLFLYSNPPPPPPCKGLDRGIVGWWGALF